MWREYHGDLKQRNLYPIWLKKTSQKYCLDVFLLTFNEMKYGLVMEFQAFEFDDLNRQEV